MMLRFAQRCRHSSPAQWVLDRAYRPGRFPQLVTGPGEPHIDGYDLQ